ncbi:MAG TPA: c-type cytochrome [Gaiellaceae bacterium]|nr:c-type cytochrome [Gaiellaceae bacterium]
MAALLGFQADSAAGQVHVARATVVTVTAGKPSELGFKLSKSSNITAGSVTFKVTNSGALSHDFKICTKAVMSDKANSCTGKVTPMLAKGKTATLTVTLKKGEYEFLCTVPGHASAGMKGLIGVGEKLVSAPVTTTTAALGTGSTSALGSSGSSAGSVTSTTTALAALVGDPVAGAAVYASAGCGSCHILKAAGSTGQVGPSLDDVAPDQQTVIQQVTNGGEIMPAFSPQLSSTQINNLAAYVYKSTH